MDNPKTRKELKKNQREKGQGPNQIYSSKHIRMIERRSILSSPSVKIKS